MREIEFRGKVKYGDDKGKWVYGYLYVYNEPKIYSILNENNVIELNQYGSNVPAFINVDPETVGQYTGLKDKNGKEIYEGDIVLVSNLAKAIIMYDDKKAVFVLNYGQDEIPIHSEIYSDLEVIGNVFDNPEWLEGEIK